jgi:hypothetical protein
MKQQIVTDIHILSENQSEKNSGSKRKCPSGEEQKFTGLFSQNWAESPRWNFFRRWKIGENPIVGTFFVVGKLGKTFPP